MSNSESLLSFRLEPKFLEKYNELIINPLNRRHHDLVKDTFSFGSMPKHCLVQSDTYRNTSDEKLNFRQNIIKPGQIYTIADAWDAAPGSAENQVVIIPLQDSRNEFVELFHLLNDAKTKTTDDAAYNMSQMAVAYKKFSTENYNLFCITNKLRLSTSLLNSKVLKINLGSIGEMMYDLYCDFTMEYVLPGSITLLSKLLFYNIGKDRNTNLSAFMLSDIQKETTKADSALLTCITKDVPSNAAYEAKLRSFDNILHYKMDFAEAISSFFDEVVKPTADKELQNKRGKTQSKNNGIDYLEWWLSKCKISFKSLKIDVNTFLSDHENVLHNFLVSLQSYFIKDKYLEEGSFAEENINYVVKYGFFDDKFPEISEKALDFKNDLESVRLIINSLQEQITEDDHTHLKSIIRSKLNLLQSCIDRESKFFITMMMHMIDKLTLPHSAYMKFLTTDILEQLHSIQQSIGEGIVFITPIPLAPTLRSINANISNELNFDDTQDYVHPLIIKQLERFHIIKAGEVRIKIKPLKQEQLSLIDTLKSFTPLLYTQRYKFERSHKFKDVEYIKDSRIVSEFESETVEESEVEEDEDQDAEYVTDEGGDANDDKGFMNKAHKCAKIAIWCILQIQSMSITIPAYLSSIESSLMKCLTGMENMFKFDIVTYLNMKAASHGSAVALLSAYEFESRNTFLNDHIVAISTALFNNPTSRLTKTSNDFEVCMHFARKVIWDLLDNMRLCLAFYQESKEFYRTKAIIAGGFRDAIVEYFSPGEGGQRLISNKDLLSFLFDLKRSMDYTTVYTTKYLANNKGAYRLERLDKQPVSLYPDLTKIYCETSDRLCKLKALMMDLNVIFHDNNHVSFLTHDIQAGSRGQPITTANTPASVGGKLDTASILTTKYMPLAKQMFSDVLKRHSPTLHDRLYALVAQTAPLKETKLYQIETNDASICVIDSKLLRKAKLAKFDPKVASELQQQFPSYESYLLHLQVAIWINIHNNQIVQKFSNPSLDMLEQRLAFLFRTQDQEIQAVSAEYNKHYKFPPLLKRSHDEDPNNYGTRGVNAIKRSNDEEMDQVASSEHSEYNQVSSVPPLKRTKGQGGLGGGSQKHISFLQGSKGLNPIQALLFKRLEKKKKALKKSTCNSNESCV